MFEKFTDRARKVMQIANQEAHRYNHEYVGTEHLLLALIREASGIAALVLRDLDLDLRRVRSEVNKIVQPGADAVMLGRLPQTPRVVKVIEFSMQEAKSLDRKCVSTEHLLLGILREGENVAVQVLLNCGFQLDALRITIIQRAREQYAQEATEAVQDMGMTPDAKPS